MGGGPCDSSVSPSPFGLEFGTLDFGTSDLGLTIRYLEEKLVCLPLLHLQLMGLLGEVEREHLDGEGGVPDQEDDAGRDDQDEDEDCVGQPLLLIGRADFIIHNHTDPLPEAFQN